MFYSGISIASNQKLGVAKVDANELEVNNGEVSIPATNFYYTGEPQLYTAPEDGIYLLEVQGAQGGPTQPQTITTGDGDYTFEGGYGGYSYGYVELKAGDQLYVNVGGAGDGTGWNGGGAGSEEATWKKLTPDMTSNTTPSGVVSASSYYDSNKEPWYAFCGTPGSDQYTWTTDQNAVENSQIQYQFPLPVRVTYLRIKNRNEGNVRAVKDFILQASNNGTDWIDLKHCTNSSGAAWATTEYNIENTDSYLYYRLFTVSPQLENEESIGYSEIILGKASSYENAGGGATHIALGDNRLLSEYPSSDYAEQKVLIAAGGGGGVTNPNKPSDMYQNFDLGPIKQIGILKNYDHINTYSLQQGTYQTPLGIDENSSYSDLPFYINTLLEPSEDDIGESYQDYCGLKLTRNGIYIGVDLIQQFRLGNVDHETIGGVDYITQYTYYGRIVTREDGVDTPITQEVTCNQGAGQWQTSQEIKRCLTSFLWENVNVGGDVFYDFLGVMLGGVQNENKVLFLGPAIALQWFDVNNYDRPTRGTIYPSDEDICTGGNAGGIEGNPGKALHYGGLGEEYFNFSDTEGLYSSLPVLKNQVLSDPSQGVAPADINCGTLWNTYYNDSQNSPMPPNPKFAIKINRPTRLDSNQIDDCILDLYSNETGEATGEKLVQQHMVDTYTEDPPYFRIMVRLIFRDTNNVDTALTGTENTGHALGQYSDQEDIHVSLIHAIDGIKEYEYLGMVYIVRGNMINIVTQDRQMNGNYAGSCVSWTQFEENGYIPPEAQYIQPTSLAKAILGEGGDQYEGGQAYHAGALGQGGQE